MFSRLKKSSWRRGRGALCLREEKGALKAELQLFATKPGLPIVPPSKAN
jgi:hypothetical protein